MKMKMRRNSNNKSHKKSNMHLNHIWKKKKIVHLKLFEHIFSTNKLSKKEHNTINNKWNNKWWTIKIKTTHQHIARTTYTHDHDDAHSHTNETILSNH